MNSNNAEDKTNINKSLNLILQIGRWGVITSATSQKICGWGEIIETFERNGAQVLIIREEPLGNLVHCYRQNVAIYKEKEDAAKKFRLNFN